MNSRRNYTLSGLANLFHGRRRSAVM